MSQHALCHKVIINKVKALGKGVITKVLLPRRACFPPVPQQGHAGCLFCSSRCCIVAHSKHMHMLTRSAQWHWVAGALVPLSTPQSKRSHSEPARHIDVLHSLTQARHALDTRDTHICAWSIKPCTRHPRWAHPFPPTRHVLGSSEWPRPPCPSTPPQASTCTPTPRVKGCRWARWSHHWAPCAPRPQVTRQNP